MSAQQHRERQRQRVDALEDCLRERDAEIVKLKDQVGGSQAPFCGRVRAGRDGGFCKWGHNQLRVVVSSSPASTDI